MRSYLSTARLRFNVRGAKRKDKTAPLNSLYILYRNFLILSKFLLLILRVERGTSFGLVGIEPLALAYHKFLTSSLLLLFPLSTFYIYYSRIFKVFQIFTSTFLRNRQSAPNKWCFQKSPTVLRYILQFHEHCRSRTSPSICRFSSL